MARHRRTHHGADRDERLGGSGRSLPRRVVVSALFWVMPMVAVVGVGGYFALALARGVFPAVVPVDGTSMLPNLHSGDLVFLRHVNVNALHKGEIVAFRTTAAAQRSYGVPSSYVHRIYQVVHGPNGIELRTKGDNVPGPDPFFTLPQDVIGRFDGRLPDVGYVALFAHSRQGLILAGVIVAVAAGYYLLMLADRRAEEKDFDTAELTALVEQVRELAASLAVARHVPLQAAPPSPAEPDQGLALPGGPTDL